MREEKSGPSPKSRRVYDHVIHVTALGDIRSCTKSKGLPLPGVLDFVARQI